MNRKLLDDLAWDERCWFMQPVDFDENYLSSLKKTFDRDKFAELILEEMYDFIMEETADDNGIPDLDKIKQHFGFK